MAPTYAVPGLFKFGTAGLASELSLVFVFGVCRACSVTE